MCASRYFGSIQRSLQLEGQDSSATELMSAFGVLISDITQMDELVPEASLPERASKALEDAVRQHVATKFSHLSDQIKAAIVEEPSSIPGATADVSRPLKASLDRAQATIIQGSLDVLQ
jgi:hypothetical protein